MSITILLTVTGITSYRLISSILIQEQDQRAQRASDFVRNLARQQITDLQDRLEITAARIESMTTVRDQLHNLREQTGATDLELSQLNSIEIETTNVELSKSKSQEEIEMIQWAHQGKPLQSKFIRRGYEIFIVASFPIRPTKKNNYSAVTAWIVLDDAWVSHVSALARTEVQIVVDEKIIATSIHRLKNQNVRPIRNERSIAYSIESVTYQMHATPLGNIETETLGYFETGEDLAPATLKLRSAALQMVGILLVGLALGLALVISTINRQTQSLKRLVFGARKIARDGPESFGGFAAIEGEAAEIRTVAQSFELMSKALKERIQNLNVARTAAIAANRAKSQFLANMSHEIRTPLNGMIGFLGLLEKSNLTPTQKEQLGIIAKSGRLLLNIITDILEFSKIEAGKLELEQVEFNLRQCVEDIVDVMSHQVFERGLELPIFLDDSIPEILIGDEGRIRQVLLNLIGNATKFTPSGEIAVSVRSKGLNPTGLFEVLFEVHDTGMGISPQGLKTIFSAFVQADVSDTRKYGGTGLGLTISKEIVQAAGGQLGVDSQEGIGSRFFFTIPFQMPSPASEKDSQSLSSNEIVVLFVNNSTVRRNLLERLEAWKVQCQTVTRLQDIENTVAAEHSRTLLLDTSFAATDEDRLLLKQLIERGCHAVLMVTPKERAMVSATFQKYGLDILSKPIKRDDLFRALEQKSNFLSDAAIPAPQQPTLKGPGQHILLVEDNTVNQQVALAILEASGFAAEVANDGREAVEKFKSGNFDLILMDCQMPVMDGFDATLEIRKVDKNIRIIAMTANAFKQTKEKCFEVGMNDFLTKPVTDEQLIEVVTRNLHSKAA